MRRETGKTRFHACVASRACLGDGRCVCEGKAWPQVLGTHGVHRR